MNKMNTVGWLVLATGALVIAAALVLSPGGDTMPTIGEVDPAPGASVLLVTIDTTRADRIGCYGADPGVTPHIDGLARAGVRFSNAQAVAPITLPSHTSMLTGLYPPQHGIRNNGMFALPESVETLASVFERRGYATGAFVSASVLARRYGLNRGFSVYDDDLSQGLNRSRHTVPARRGDLTVEAATRWLAARESDEKFFCWVHLYDPHAPYDPPMEYKQAHPSDPYLGEIAFTDEVIGRLLGWLEDSGRRESTVVAVVSDHGEAFGEHGEKTHAILLHQATTAVPWVMAGPGLPSGETIPAPVSGVDVAPTLAWLAGVEPPNDEVRDGRVVLDIDALSDSASGERLIYSETLLPTFQYGWAPLQGVRRAEWQLIAGRFKQIFNLKDDPRELIDVKDREPDVLTLLEADLDAFPTDDPHQDGEARLELSRSEMEQLEALGYLGTDAVRRGDGPDPRTLIGAHVQIEAARSLSNQGNVDKAIEALGTTLEMDPGNVAALAMRAQLFTSARRFDEAREDLRHSLQIDPDSAATYALMARVEMLSGNPLGALEIARTGSTKRGAFEQLVALQANALMTMNRTDEAVAVLDERLEHNPEDPDLLAARAQIHAVRGEVDAAEELLRTAVRVDAMHITSRFALARLLSDQGRMGEAVALLEDMLQIQPGHPAALAMLGNIQLTDPASAKAYLEEAVRLDPSRFEPMVNLGLVYIQLGYPEQAEGTLRRALALREGDLSCRNNLAIALTLQGRLDEAATELRDLVAEHPDFAEAYNNLALVLERQGRAAEAEAAVRRALELDPSRPDANLTLATMLLERGDNREVVDLLEGLQREHPDHLLVAARLAMAYESLGMTDRALPLFRMVVAANPPDLEILLAAARTEREAGDRAAALDIFERVARAAPPGDNRDEALSAIQEMSRAGN
jgi:arylsulfatase A-like enzyme/Tfp pilus assembly protein PilF